MIVSPCLRWPKSISPLFGRCQLKKLHATTWPVLGNVHQIEIIDVDRAVPACVADDELAATRAENNRPRAVAATVPVCNITSPPIHIQCSVLVAPTVIIVNK